MELAVPSWPVFLAIAATGLLLATWIGGEPLRVALRRLRVRARPFPAEWRAILRRRVPYFYTLPADLQLQLKKRIQVFLDEKHFVGCAGFAIDDEVRVTIAAQACLLLLNRRTDYFPSLREILVYPGAFVVTRGRTQESGIRHEGRVALAGESWAQGQVVLSWGDVLAGAATVDDGRNVVIHEFAHQLDQEKGHANGAPWLPSRAAARRWTEVLGREYAALRARVAQPWPAAAGEPGGAPVTIVPPLIDAYGATDPAEFFAVVSEVFFEQPARLATEHPALYREFARYYRVDPLTWR